MILTTAFLLRAQFVIRVPDIVPLLTVATSLLAASRKVVLKSVMSVAK